MRRTFVILMLWLMMLGLRTLTVSGEHVGEYASTLTLAATGFVVLAAFAVAELGGRLSLPKVTGYILCGIAFGPYALNVLQQAEVQELKMFSQLALGLIALTAGLELDLRGLMRLAKTLSITVGIKIVLGFAVVGLVLAVVASATGWLGPRSTTELTALALIFGALSLGTSPAIALAVASESKASGRLTELVLGAAVVKDVVVVVCLSIALAFGKAMLGGGELSASVLVDLGKHLLEEVALGAAIGALLIAYLRFIHREMLLVVVVVVLLGSTLCNYLHIEALLVFIVAGAVVRNASKFEHELLHPLETISLPIFIVFFTNAGAGINLQETLQLLPMALIICGTRAGAFFIAGTFGGRLGGESDTVQRNAWLAYLPQAGVTLGLATQTAPGVLSDHPDIATTVSGLGMAMVAVNLLVGPITLRMALRNAGEIPSDAQAGEDEAAKSPDQPAPTEPEADQSSPEPLESERLRDLVDDVVGVLTESWAGWRRTELKAELEQWRTALSAECSDNLTEATNEVARRLERLPSLDAEGRTAELGSVLARQSAKIESLPDRIRVPLEDRHRLPHVSDGVVARVIKRLTGVGATLIGRRTTRTREVPIRMLARTLVEPAMSATAEETLRDLQRFEVLSLEIMQRVALGTTTWSEGQEELETLFNDTKDKMTDNHNASIEAVKSGLRREWGRLGAPAQFRAPRFSSVAAAVDDAMRRIGHDGRRWTEQRSAAIRTLRFVTEVEMAGLRLAEGLTRDVAVPLDETFGVLQRLVDEQRSRTEALPSGKDLADDEEWQRLGARVRAVLPKPSQRELRVASTRARRATSGSAAMGSALSFVADGEAKIRIVPSLHDMARTPRPASIEPVKVDVRELKEVQISGQLLPDLEDILEQVNESLITIRESMREAASLVEFGFSAADSSRADNKDDAIRKFDESRERAIAMLTHLRDGSCEEWNEHRNELLEKAQLMPDQLMRALQAAGQGRIAPGSPSSMSRLQNRAGRAARTLRDRVVQLVELVRSGEAGQTADDLAMRYRLRTGDRRVDAQAINGYLDEQRKVRKSTIEGLYASLFTPEPLRDPRLFVAHRDALASVVRAARSWQTDPKTGNGALVLGGSGSGKSSTLSIAQLKVGARRVLPIRRGATEDKSVHDALGRALGCEPEDAAVIRALRGQRTVIVIDDLHHWLAPTREGLAQLRRLQQLMASTLETTFYLCSLSTHAFEVWMRAAAIEQSFACTVRLTSVDAEKLDRVLAARHELSGMPLEFPATRWAQLAERLLSRPVRTSFVTNLATVSRGNLRRALALWLAHARHEDHGIHLKPLASVGWGLPFVHQLGPQAMALLATLLRHGPQNEETLAQALGTPPEELAQLGRYLVASGLVERHDGSGQLQLDPMFIDDLVQVLGEYGVVGGDA